MPAVSAGGDLKFDLRTLLKGHLAISRTCTSYAVHICKHSDLRDFRQNIHSSVRRNLRVQQEWYKKLTTRRLSAIYDCVGNPNAFDAVWLKKHATTSRQPSEDLSFFRQTSSFIIPIVFLCLSSLRRRGQPLGRDLFPKTISAPPETQNRVVRPSIIFCRILAQIMIN